MRYFLTGATGFIGGRLARQLREAGHKVVALVRDPTRGVSLSQLGVELVPGDITDRASLLQGMRGVDGVFHCAGWYKLGVKDPQEGIQINVEGTRNVLETMRDLHVPRGVYTSTLAVFSDTHGKLVDENYKFHGRHLTMYDQSKWRAHYEVAEPLVRHGLPLTIVLPGVVYGPGDASPIGDMFARYQQRKLPGVPAKTAYCWAHVEDTARGHILAMEQGRSGEQYIIAGEPMTVASVLALAETITHIPAPRRTLSPVLLRLLASLFSIVGRAVPLPQEYQPEVLRASAGVTYLGDNGKARRELGFVPRPISEGLREVFSTVINSPRRLQSKE
ncbi:MAG: NAD-dependent epimerase/dehydratase family protein [Gemmatimonadota bacterium]